MRSAGIAAVGGLAFALAATLNAGGYRYGASDQAFYIPAILRHVDPRLFPRDAALIESQARLFVLDELAAWLLDWSPVGLEGLFLAGYLLTLALLAIGLMRLGAAWLASPWSVAAFVAASALRHRIAKTGANTLEGYFHPRQLAFAIGVLGLVAVMRRRPPLALAAVGVAAVVHPTTAMFFAAWIGIALLVEERAWRRPLAALGAVGVLAAALLLAGGFLPMARMDAPWVATLADKDYVFPTAWRADTWALNLLYPIVIAATFVARRRRGLVRPGEAGIVAGCLALVAAFVLALPLVAVRVAFAVQLQVSRVFWMADLIAVLSIVWWLAEARRTRPRSGAAVAQAAAAAEPEGPAAVVGQGFSPALTRRPAMVFGVLAAAALARGAYVLGVEHAGRPVLQVALPRDAWQDASVWIATRTAAATHVLADPDHAWRYGTSLRVSARRDVFLENVKDGSIGMYDRDVAMRVIARRQALGDFGALTPEAIRALAARYDLGVLLAERPLPFAELYRNDRFFVYRLQP